MAQTLTTKIKMLLTATLENTVGLAAGSAHNSCAAVISLASGFGANQADRIFSETRTIAASGTNEMDLAGTLTDIFGAVITFARIKAIVIVAAAANVNVVVVGGAAANAFVGPFADAT